MKPSLASLTTQKTYDSLQLVYRRLISPYLAWLIQQQHGHESSLLPHDVISLAHS